MNEQEFRAHQAIQEQQIAAMHHQQQLMLEQQRQYELQQQQAQQQALSPQQQQMVAAQQMAVLEQQQLQHQLMLQQQRAAAAAAAATASANPLGALPTILCCECGVSMLWNPASMCVTCIRSRVDISEGIPKQGVLHWCRTCGRYLQPPRNWIVAPLESKELLTLCMRRMRGLNKVKLVDACFVWTEPHSRRIKVKLTIQKEVFSSTILQQSFLVEFVVESFQCDTCKRVGTDQSWKAVVQVRQKADHRRTFFLLEQLLIKHNAHNQCTNIKECSDGMDFYFQHRSHALKFMEFLNGVVPIRKKGESERLLSSDKQSNTANTKITFSIEIAPICKDDLICLTPQQYREYGGIGPLLVCTHVSSHMRFVDPITLKNVDIPNQTYWKRPLTPICTHRTKTDFTILDVERIPQIQLGRLCLAEVEVARAGDLGVNDDTSRLRSFLGNILHPGDTAQGYDLRHANLNDTSLDAFQGRVDLPDIVLVCKSYAQKRRKRQWKLKTLGATIEDEDGSSVASATERKAPRPRRGGDNNLAEKRQQEYEAFLAEVEHDPELRSRINIYKDAAAAEANSAAMVDEGEDDGEDDGEIGVEELLDDLDIDPEGDDEEGDEEDE